MLASLLLVLALSGDGSYDVDPIPLVFDRAIVQDFLDREQTFIQRQIVIWYRVVHLFNWSDDAGWVYEGWVLIKRDGIFIDKRYPFFEKFILKFWELRVTYVEYEISDRRVEETYNRATRIMRLKESGS